MAAAFKLGQNSVCILGTARTPVGSLGGSLASVSAVDLLSTAFTAALTRSGIKPAHINEVYAGSVLQAGLAQAPARQAALKSGLDKSTPCTTVNKVCASGLKSVIIGAQTILCGSNEAVLCGGTESMSNVPYYVSRQLRGVGNGKLLDGIAYDGLTDPYSESLMGTFGDKCAEKHGLSRETQDAWAAESYRRAREAAKNGAHASEIVPVKAGRKGELVSTDDEPSSNRGGEEALRTMKPAFSKTGTVTAGSSSTISDGAAAIVISSGEFAKREGLKPKAWIVACSDAAREPEDFPIAPHLAIEKMLKATGWTVDSVDAWEINEAFSCVVLANMKLLGIESTGKKVNIHGGAAAIGHPLGASGARILVSLITALERTGGKRGIAAICNGGGGASAIAIELADQAPKARL